MPVELQICEPERPSVHVHANVVPAVHGVDDVSAIASAPPSVVGVTWMHARLEARMTADEKTLATTFRLFTRCSCSHGTLAEDGATHRSRGRWQCAEPGVRSSAPRISHFVLTMYRTRIRSVKVRALFGANLTTRIMDDSNGISWGPSVPDRAVILSDARGEMAWWEGSPIVVRTQLRRYLSQSLCEQMIALTDKHTGGRRIHLFHDWAGYTGHDAGARSFATQWSFKNRERIASLHILMPPPTKMLAMAIAASNMVLGGLMRIHQSAPQFENEFRRVAAG